MPRCVFYNRPLSSSIGAGGQKSFAAGYYDAGSISAGGADTSATAIASEILSGKTAWVNGTKIIGTMVNQGSISRTLSSGETLSYGAGYYSSIYVKAPTVTNPTHTGTTSTYTVNAGSSKTIDLGSNHNYRYVAVQATSGGSSEPSYTTLWTNPSPSADFAGQTVTLSSNMNNYDFIRVTYKLHKTSTGTYEVWMPRSVFTSTASGKNNSTCQMILGGNCGTGSSSRNSRRTCYYTSTTSVEFGEANYGTNKLNQDAIPVAIYGVNF